MSTSASDRLLRWYENHARDLPWRQTDDPYAIWIAEVMLQQTQVETVIPYYQRWLRTFPDVNSLAQATTDQVLVLWEGLGYYRRAHNLLRAARVIVEDHEGSLPATAAELERLPGIGAYTAAAIAAIAFDVDEVALDGNLRRVLSRLFNIADPIGSKATDHTLRRRANGMLASDQASAFNQAMMDLGAMVCRPRVPLCGRCPLAGDCLAHRHNVQMERPVRRSRKDIPERYRVAAVITDRSRVLLGRRPRGGLLGGLWEFPGGSLKDDERAAAGVARVVRESLGVEVDQCAFLAAIEHAYTHYRVRVQSFLVETSGQIADSEAHSEIQWADIAELSDYPMGKVDRRIARELGEREYD
jgi:A/G-specific adenine glycosylase